MNDSLRGKRVLVVEDNFHIADDLRRALHSHGATVVGPTGSIAAAMSHADTALDGALIDVNLGDSDSYCVADRLTENKVPFIFVTGYERSLIRADYQQVPHMQKPFTVSAMIQCLEDLIEGNRARCTNDTGLLR